MTTDKRLQRSSESATARFKFLSAIIEAPQHFKTDEQLRSALRSQGGFANYKNAEHGINNYSLNALKQAADKTINGGFKALDLLRTHAKEALLAQEKAYTAREGRNKTDLEARSIHLKEEIQALKEDLETLTWALAKSLSQSKNYAKDSNIASISARCKKEQNELIVMLSTRLRLNRKNITE